VTLYLFIYLLETTVGPYTNRRLKTHITINPKRKKEIGLYNNTDAEITHKTN